MRGTNAILRVSATRAAAATAAVLAVILATAAVLYVRQSRTIEAQEHAHGTLLLDMAENGLRAHLRAEQYHPEHLEDWFLSLMVSAQLGGIRLDDGAHQEILALGVYMEPLESPDTADYVEIRRKLPALESLPPPRGWRRGMVRRPGQGPGIGQGRGAGPGMGAGMGWLPLPPGPYTFTLALDGAPWRERRHTLRMQTLAGVVLACACTLLLSALLLLRERQVGLHLQLAASEEQASRQAMLAQLGAGLAHETKNPLGLVRGLAQGIREQAELDKTTKKRLSDIIDETDRVVGRIDSFLSFAKPVEPDRKSVPLTPLFSEIEALLRNEAVAANITLTLDGAGVEIDADPELLRRALLNLLLNAFKACKGGGAVSVVAERLDRQSVSIVVRDTGVGIAPEDLPRITTPYFSRFEEGVGLGLALTDEIVRAHGWQLAFTSTPGEGTEAIITGIMMKETSA